MKVTVLSSGSKGNTTYIETRSTKILIDIGNSCKYVTEKLNTLGVSSHDIEAILITHTHIDHVKGLKTFTNKNNPKVYITEKMYPDLNYLKNYEYITSNVINIKDLTITIIKTSHDAEDSIGFIIANEKKSLVYITDTGYINQKYHPLLKNKDIYIMESNHDIEMLNNSSYPFKLRQRILSDKGHLSNYDSSKYLGSFIGDDTKYIFLAHLSEENNTRDLAESTLQGKLEELHNTKIKIIVTTQNKETELVEI